MKFKHTVIESEYGELHPDVRYVLDELDAWSIARGLPEVVVTCIKRDDASNKAVGGVAKSWHLWSAAADVRSTHYTPEERADVLKWLAVYCPKPAFELLYHDVQTGPHIHVARADLGWRNTFEKRPARA